ncbi:hypothetical protein Plhal710r2_c055g0165081 [Plasmopara halstedii]
MMVITQENHGLCFFGCKACAARNYVNSMARHLGRALILSYIRTDSLFFRTLLVYHLKRARYCKLRRRITYRHL